MVLKLRLEFLTVVDLCSSSRFGRSG